MELCLFIPNSRIRLKNVPSARIAIVLLHELSHNYTISYIAFVQGVNLPHPPSKFRGQLENSVIGLKDKAKLIQNCPRTQMYLNVC